MFEHMVVSGGERDKCVMGVGCRDVGMTIGEIG